MRCSSSATRAQTVPAREAKTAPWTQTTGTPSTSCARTRCPRGSHRCKRSTPTLRRSTSIMVLLPIPDWRAVPQTKCRKTVQQAVFRHFVFPVLSRICRVVIMFYLVTRFFARTCAVLISWLPWLADYMRKRFDRFQSLPDTIASLLHTCALLSAHHCIACIASTRFRSDREMGRFSTSPTISGRFISP